VGENIRQEAIMSNYLATLNPNNDEYALEKDRVLSHYSGMPIADPSSRSKNLGGYSTMSRGSGLRASAVSKSKIS
jgi:hypothetical protein